MNQTMGIAAAAGAEEEEEEEEGEFEIDNSLCYNFFLLCKSSKTFNNISLGMVTSTLAYLRQTSSIPQEVRRLETFLICDNDTRKQRANLKRACLQGLAQYIIMYPHLRGSVEFREECEEWTCQLLHDQILQRGGGGAGIATIATASSSTPVAESFTSPMRGDSISHVVPSAEAKSIAAMTITSINSNLEGRRWDASSSSLSTFNLPNDSLMDELMEQDEGNSNSDGFSPSALSSLQEDTGSNGDELMLLGGGHENRLSKGSDDNILNSSGSNNSASGQDVDYRNLDENLGHNHYAIRTEPREEDSVAFLGIVDNNNNNNHNLLLPIQQQQQELQQHPLQQELHPFQPQQQFFPAPPLLSSNENICVIEGKENSKSALRQLPTDLIKRGMVGQCCKSCAQKYSRAKNADALWAPIPVKFDFIVVFPNPLRMFRCITCRKWTFVQRTNKQSKQCHACNH